VHYTVLIVTAHQIILSGTIPVSSCTCIKAKWHL